MITSARYLGRGLSFVFKGSGRPRRRTGDKRFYVMSGPGWPAKGAYERRGT